MRPPADGCISISAVPPDSYASCSALAAFFSSSSFFWFCFHAGEGERDQTTHTDPGLHPPPTHPPSLPPTPAICARPSACNSNHNNKALNLRRGVNPSLEEGERKETEKQGSKKKREMGEGEVVRKRGRGEEKRK